jgi:hypothetical protein
MNNLTQTNPNKLRLMLGLFLLGTITVVLQGCDVHYVSTIPLATVQIRPVSPFVGAVWIDGGWEWRGGRHTQVMGYWDRPRGRTMYPGEWRSNNRGHYWVPGRRR